MLGAMLLTARECKPEGMTRHVVALIVVVVTGTALLYALGDMPVYGDPSAPVNAYVGMDYVAKTQEDIKIPNIVTAVLASYRGFDTLGETFVVFAAGLGVALLLGLGGRKEEDN